MKSMTGYGRGNAVNASFSVTTELSAVNRKQLELAINVPRECLILESQIREILQAHLSRGRINVVVNISRFNTLASEEVIDPVAAESAVLALLKLQQQYQFAMGVDLASVLAMPGVVRTAAPTVEPQEVWPCIERSLRESLDQLIAMREREGHNLLADLAARTQTLRGALEEIRRLHPAVAEKYRVALVERVRKAGLDLQLDDERLLRETVLYAERIDISEELTRIDSHLDQFSEKLTLPEPVGRTLEFIVQEIGREFNTLGAKANDSVVSQIVVTCKVDLEKIREQIQNIE